MTQLEKFNQTVFENIKHINEFGNEYWEARELQKILGYKEWRFFQAVIEKAQVACAQSNNQITDHFGVYSKIVKTGLSSKNIIDYELSRYACYLIVQNGNPKHLNISLGQTYFAVQTRKQEINEIEYELLTEDEKRFYRRTQTRSGNYSLNQAAKEAGVKNFGKFHDQGYIGLYGGETAGDIAKRKKLRYREDILDNMCSEELIANLFRISQTESKLKRDNIKIAREANKIHLDMGKAIRELIKMKGGIMPEDHPTPNKSLKELERNNFKSVK